MPGPKRSRTRLVAATSVAALTALAPALAGCSASGPAADSGSRDGLVTAKGSRFATAAPGHRQDAPDISGTTLDGRPIRLSDHRGKVVVLNLWGSWCNPCRTEAPGLQTLWERYRAQGVQFFGIDTKDNDPDNAVAFERSKGITFPSVYDQDGTQVLKFPKGSINPKFIPSTIVVDRDGGLAARAFGAQSADTVEAMIRPVLAEPAPRPQVP
ncbi:TlpA family protein disulfide reductase [Kitasatospora sp. NBC_01539]|uniref:TlpA family protein disulfide reductase n=1 Tax=Kitasatospora sp. NBC_01539 TaxID=2903577 RepID=UPI0038602845